MEDNARKFIVEKIDLNFLKGSNSISFVLAVDWMETNEDTEKKLAFKRFDNEDSQILLISKITNNGSRISDKKMITEDEYKKLLKSSLLHLVKKRYEFTFTQNNISYTLKYDEFNDGTVCILEVDALNEKERRVFDPDAFPYRLSEVTGDVRYYGYRIASML